jgi:hypothetical protein
MEYLNGDFVYDPESQQVISNGSTWAGVHLEVDAAAKTATSISMNGTGKPGGRYSSHLAYDTHQKLVFMYGGAGGWDCCWLYDTWWYNPTTGTWREVQTTKHPTQGCYTSMDYDTLNQVFLLYGGVGAAGTSTFVDEVWAFDTKTEEWSQVTIAAGAKPYPGAYYATQRMAYHKGEQVFVYMTEESGNTEDTVALWYFKYEPSATGIAAKKIPAAENFSISVDPNPFKSLATIAFKGIDEKQEIKVEILDVSGRRVREFSHHTASPIALDGAALRSGIYYVRAKYNSKIFVRKACLLR